MRAADDGRDVSAAWKPRPGCVGARQLRALVGAARWAGVSAGDVRRTMATVTGIEDVEDLTPEAWADLMDRFVVVGFRDPAVPMVTPVQLATLDEMRRFLGLDGRTFVGLVRQLGGVRSRRQLDGSGFLQVWAWLARHGADTPVPGHGFMSRRLMRMVHEAAYGQEMDADRLTAMLAPIGGVLRASQLDRRGFLRLMLTFDRNGVPAPELPPRVPGDLGMVTQAQANLVWRLWLDMDGWKGDTSPAALDAAIGSLLGMGGGLATLTRAGARAVLDRFMVPRLNDRRAADGGDRPPPAAAPAAGSKRARRRHGGRR